MVFFLIQLNENTKFLTILLRGEFACLEGFLACLALTNMTLLETH